MKAKKKIIITLLVVLLAVLGAFVGVRHWVNQQVAASKRIVATTDAITEIFAALNVKLVGVPTTQQKLPAKYAHVTHVGSPMSPSVEKIASLNPDRVYAVSTLKDQYSNSFKQQSVPVTYLKLDTVAQLKQTLQTLGKQYMRTSQANAQIKRINQAVAAAKKRIKKKHPRVLVLLGMPGAGYLIATNKTYVGDLVRLAGGTNVYQSSTQSYIHPSNESLATKKPDVILRLAHALPKVTIPEFNQEFAHNSVWKTMPAVKNKRVYDLIPPTFNASANLEMPQALTKISKWLYPSN